MNQSYSSTILQCCSVNRECRGFICNYCMHNTTIADETTAIANKLPNHTGISTCHMLCVNCQHIRRPASPWSCQIFYGCCLLPWLYPHLVKLQCDMYFRFWRWRYVFKLWIRSQCVASAAMSLPRELGQKANHGNGLDWMSMQLTARKWLQICCSWSYLGPVTSNTKTCDVGGVHTRPAYWPARLRSSSFANKNGRRWRLINRKYSHGINGHQ